MGGWRASRQSAQVLLLALPACVASDASCAGPPASCTGPSGEGGFESVVLAGVEDRLVLRLSDGRQLRLAGLDPAEGTPDEPGRAEEARAALLGLAGGKPLSVVILEAEPDRWGRRAALAYAAATTSSLAEAALAAGLGRYLPEPLAHACRGRLLAAESRARAARAGLWSDPYYAVLAPAEPNDRAALADRSATIAVAEGRLTQVVPGPYRTELHLGAGDRRDVRSPSLSLAIAPRVAKAFKDGGIDLSSLIGRSLRVRGLLDLRFGPRLELSGPDALEILPDERPGGAGGAG